MILRKMKKTAETYLGTTVTKAVITVPSYFGHSQRQITMDAASMAGLNVVRLIREPTAAAIAYNLVNHIQEERTVLIVDIGAAAINVSILTIEKDILDVTATASDSHIGGEFFDSRLVSHFIQEFNRSYTKDIFTNPRGLKRQLKKDLQTKKTRHVARRLRECCQERI
ncbi:70-kilodalton heat shock protein [Blyttiomyces sp. JEL0837]|nr:70-kilodalton heat shock protein [Blyttiomyces sp. JEL0837]